MFKTFLNAFKDREIRNKIFLTVFILLVYRIGCYVPIPGIDISVVQQVFANNDFMQVMSTITGGSLSNGTLFALGIVPFINASIIMQLLSLVVPYLERLGKEGDEGIKKKTRITRYLAVILAAVQGIGIVIGWQSAVTPIFNSTILSSIFIVLILIGGASLVMWLGERITEYGVSNGISLIIFIGILAGTASAMGTSIGNIGNDIRNLWYLIGFILIIIGLFTLIVFIDLSVRKIPVQYAKQVKGNKMYGGQSTHIPMKINASGVMPIIFATSFLMFPQMIASFWPQSAFYAWYARNLGMGSWVYIIALSLLILFFAFFYAMIQFNPDDVSRNIQRYGGFIPGTRPGKPTAEYLSKINNRITLFGAIFLAFIALLPSIGFLLMGNTTGLTNAFTATGMLIVVSVALEFDKQLEAQLTMKHHKGFLK